MKKFIFFALLFFASFGAKSQNYLFDPFPLYLTGDYNDAWINTQTRPLSFLGVAVAIPLTNSQTGTLTATIPANALTINRTVNSGTATVTYVTGTEVTY